MGVLAALLGQSSSSASRVEPPLASVSGTAGPASWFVEGGWQTFSRVKALPAVTAVAAQKHATVTACCSVIAGDTSKVPLQVCKRGKYGEETVVEDHPANYLLNVESSSGVAASTLRFTLAYFFCLRGEAFAFAPRNGAGELVFLDALRNGDCHVLRDGRRRFYEFEDGDDVRRRVSSNQVVHLRYMSEDGWTGRSPIEVAAESVGIALARQEAAARAASGTTLKAIAKLEDRHDDEESRKRRAEALKNNLLSGGGQGVAVIGENDDIRTLDMSAADLQLLESQKLDVALLRSLYRVPAFKLQDPDGGVKANGEQQAIDYLKDCLLHWGTPIEDQLALTVLTEKERRSGLFLRHDFNALLRPTAKERYAAIKEAVGGPFMSPNEGRRLIGMAPTDGGDAMYPPPNMTQEKETGDDTEE